MFRFFFSLGNRKRYRIKGDVEKCFYKQKYVFNSFSIKLFLDINTFLNDL